MVDIAGVVGARHQGHAMIGAEKRRSELGDELLPGVVVVTEVLAVPAVAAALRACPVDELMEFRTQVRLGGRAGARVEESIAIGHPDDVVGSTVEGATGRHAE